MRPVLSIRHFSHWHEAVLAVLLLALLGWARIVDPSFLAPATRAELSTHVWELALLALPMTLIILTGGIDLSVGATMALAAVVLGLGYEAGWPIPIAIIVAVLTGLFGGLVNGMAVTGIGVHPLIVTLATMAAYRGVAEGISMARPISGFPEAFAVLGQGTVAGIPVPGLIFAVAFCLVGAFLWLMPWGRCLYAIGHNERACRFSGIPSRLIKLWLYALSGATAGLTAVLYVSRRNTAKADIGTGLELDVITAVVLGGTSIFGGRGGLCGTFLGILLIHEVREFVTWHWNRGELVLVVVGALLILSVSLHKFMGRKRAE